MLSLFKKLLGAHDKYARVNGAEAHEILKTNPQLQILDVRTPGEVREGKIQKSIHIDFFGGNFTEVAKAKLDPTKPVLVYCRSGNRSSSACGMLANLGFTEVYNLKGGFGSW